MSHRTLFARALWTLVCPIALVCLLVPVATEGGLWNLAYAGTITLLVAGRWLEHRSGHGKTIYGDDSTPANTVGFIWKAVLIAGIAWGGARFLAGPH